MRVVVRAQLASPFVDELRAAVGDEQRDKEKYARLANEATAAVPGPLGTTVSGELAGISEQEDSHLNTLECMIRALEAFQRTGAQVGRLPVVTRGGKSYYFDYRLRQLRNTKNPSDYIDLNEFEAEQLRKEVGE